MLGGKRWPGPFLFAALVAVTNVGWALGLELGESKEELKLKYDVSVTDHGTGRVTVVLSIADTGRLGDLTAIEFDVPPAEGTGYVDLSVALAPRVEDGKQVVRVHGLRELVQRGHLQLNTGGLDGKVEPLTWYYHVIPIADHLKPTARPDDRSN